MSDQPTIVAAIVTGPAGVLLAKRRDGKPPWTFPAGAQEPGETYADTAARETLEETGLAIVTRQELGDRIHPATGRRMVYVAAEPANGTDVRVCDHDELCEVGWFEWEALGEMLPQLFAPVAAHLRATLA